MDLLKSLTLALALCLAAPALPAAAQTQPPAVLAQAELMQTVQRYADAWASRDADKIAALHSADSVFHLFVEGSQAASGKAAFQAQFQKILSDNPGCASTVRSINSGNGPVVFDSIFAFDLFAVIGPPALALLAARELGRVQEPAP